MTGDLSSTCLSDADLVAFIEGTLNPDELPLLHRHIAGCSTCRGLVAGLADASLSRLGSTAQEPPPVDRWTPPATVAEFCIGAPLGQGAMGQVFAGRDTLLDRPVAVKFLNLLGPTERERFLVEARAIARLNHPNVVTLYRVGEVDSRPYLVSELVSGVGLDRVSLPVPWQRALDIGVDLAAGLAEAHQRGVVHRDIKPANVIVSDKGVVKLLDFGLARLFQLPQPASPPSAAPARLALTRPGAVMGTPLYMSPEAWTAREPEPQTDIYSVGALLYELCGGQLPHSAGNLAALRGLVLMADIPPLDVAGMDPEFAALIARCLQRDPARRPPHGEALLQALLPIQKRARQLAAAPLASAANAAGPDPPGPAWPPLLLFGLVVLTSAGLTLGVLRPHAPQPAPRPAPVTTPAAVPGPAPTRAEPLPVPPGMAYLAGGRFQMGSTEQEADAGYEYCRRIPGNICRQDIYTRETPTRQVELSPFALNRYEVTNVEFAHWLNERRHKLRVDRKGAVRSGDGTLLADLSDSQVTEQIIVRGGILVAPDLRFQPRPGHEDRPVASVTWYGASQYCQFHGWRLPTEAEWEFAARGAERRRFPWGEQEPGCRGVIFDRVPGGVCRDLSEARPERIGQAQQDRTAAGIYDLGGNVQEWVLDRIPAERAAPGKRIIRGGSFWQPAHVTRGAGRSVGEPEQASFNVGFRCAQSLAR